MGKSGRNYRERGRRNDGRPGSMRPDFDEEGSMKPDFEPEKSDDFMDIYTDTDQLDLFTEHYQWEDEDDI
jgi:hypothetical protein